jgi:tetratricopeptide (TPR) repeat protein/serine/threonine protein kinase
MNESQVFRNALQRATPAERAAYLDEACAGDPALRAAVDALLRAHDRAPDFLEQPLSALAGTVDGPAAAKAAVGASAGRAVRPGAVLGGRYKLLQEIGAGGMGAVWLAEQQEPVRRQVALKVVKAGLDSRSVLARFEAERQALALMDHPHIAKVLDAGASPEGRPYFVMELVKGVPLTQYCDENRLTPRERLELFVPVCQAVQHAHQKGVIHRDLKPSNVLVAPYDGKPVVKVIDFGVAKAAGPRLTDQTLFTEFGQVVGTLEYMSPEQAELNNQDIDTRSDVYSLGVLLYELLTGTTPLDRKRRQGASFTDLLRLIREEDPPRPSTRLSESRDTLPTVSAQRQTEPAKLTRLVRGELDWIVMKALDKDRGRRYESAAGLARDLERYLHDEPVQACPPSAAYRLRKFLRRHKGPVLVGAGVFLALLVALSGVAGGIGWAVRDRSAHRAAAEQQVREDLVEATRLLPTAGWPAAEPFVRRAQTAVAGVAIDPGLARQVEELDQDLEMARRLEEAWVHPRKGDNDRKRMHAAYAAAFAWYGLDVDRLDPGEAAARMRARSIRPQLAAALDQWAFIRKSLKLPGVSRLLAASRAADPDQARDRLRDGLAGLRDGPGAAKELAAALAGEDLPPATAVLLAFLCIEADVAEVAVAALQKAHQQHPEDFYLNFELGTALHIARPPRLEGTIRYLTAAVSLRPESAVTRNDLGAALLDKGYRDEAIAAFREAVRLEPRYARAHSNLGGALQLKGRLDEAVAECREALRFDPGLALAHRNLGLALRKQGKLEEAVVSFRKALEFDPKNAESHIALGGALAAQEKWDAASARFHKALDLDPKNAGAHGGIGMTLARQGNLGEAIAWYKKALECDPKAPEAHYNLGNALFRQKKWDEAAACYHKALEFDPESSKVHLNLAVALVMQRKWDEAIASYRKVLELDPKDARAHNGLGGVLANQGKPDAALAHFRKAHELNPKDAVIHTNLCRVLNQQGRFGEVIAVYKKVLELDPGNTDVRNDLAWALATCPDLRQRNATEAVKLAEAAVRQAPRDGNVWNTLGVARYRAGDWKGAREALGQSTQLHQGGGASDWFFLAMAHWQLGQKDKARRWYGRSVRWMDEHDPQNEELRRFRAEAEALLGMGAEKHPEK